MHYLTANGGTFVVHQYSIGQGWACPAFVAIQPSARMVCVVGVSAGWDLAALVQRVRNCQVQWWNQLIPHLQQRNVIAADWHQHVAVFIRQDRVAWFQQAIAGTANVSVIPLEPILAAWNWPKDARAPQFSPCPPPRS